MSSRRVLDGEDESECATCPPSPHPLQPRSAAEHSVEKSTAVAPQPYHPHRLPRRRHLARSPHRSAPSTCPTSSPRAPRGRPSRCAHPCTPAQNPLLTRPRTRLPSRPSSPSSGGAQRTTRSWRAHSPARPAVGCTDSSNSHREYCLVMLGNRKTAGPSPAPPDSVPSASRISSPVTHSCRPNLVRAVRPRRWRL